MVREIQKMNLLDILKRIKDILIYINHNLLYLNEYFIYYIFVRLKISNKLKNNNNKNYLFLSKSWHGEPFLSNRNDAYDQIVRSFNDFNKSDSCIYPLSIDEELIDCEKIKFYNNLIKCIYENNITHIIYSINSNSERLINFNFLNKIIKKIDLHLILMVSDSVWFLNQLILRRYKNNCKLIISLDSNVLKK